MEIGASQEKLLQRFYPGLLHDIRALGAGAFISAWFKLHPWGPKGIRGVEQSLEYKFADGMMLAIHITLRRRDEYGPYQPSDDVDLSTWQPTYYCLNYGPSLLPSIFRCDLDKVSGHHVHMQPDTTKHYPADEVTPNTRDIHPRDFVAIVARYRGGGTYPLKRKKP